MFKKMFYDVKRCFSDIKKFEKTKTLYKDDKENLNDKLLIFMINNY